LPSAESGTSLIEANRLERPTLEFLATSVFGIVQSGSREIPNLKVTPRSSAKVTLHSKRSRTPLFGEALKTVSPGFVYLDAPADELSFTGATDLLGSFTLSAFFYVPESSEEALVVAVPHGLGDIDVTSAALTNWRLLLKLLSGQAAFAQTNSAGGTFSVQNSGVTGDGWTHFAIAYDAAEQKIKHYKSLLLRALLSGCDLQSSRFNSSINFPFTCGFH